jgi:hypothetical protein
VGDRLDRDGAAARNAGAAFVLARDKVIVDVRDAIGSGSSPR